MSHFRAKMHQIWFLVSVRYIVFVCLSLGWSLTLMSLRGPGQALTSLILPFSFRYRFPPVFPAFPFTEITLRSNLSGGAAISKLICSFVLSCLPSRRHRRHYSFHRPSQTPLHVLFIPWPLGSFLGHNSSPFSPFPPFRSVPITRWHVCGNYR